MYCRFAFPVLHVIYFVLLGASAVPSDLRILHLAPTCADLEWSCGNTSMLHAIFLNGNEIHIVKPGIDQFKLTNLSPDHEYEVNVEARAPANAHKRPKNFDSRSNELIFRTPKPGNCKIILYIFKSKTFSQFYLVGFPDF